MPPSLLRGPRPTRQRARPSPSPRPSRRASLPRIERPRGPPGRIPATSRADGRISVDACLGACSRASYGCNPSTECELSCGHEGTTCSKSEERECASSGFKATLPATANPELEAACNRYRALLTSCGAQDFASSSTCTVLAKTEQPERAATYDGLAKQPCEAKEKEVSASCAPAITTLGDEVCAPMGGCDSICSDEQQAMLNLEGGWLRSDVQKVARDCRAAGTCSDVR